jgi:hypothetical protein
LCCICTTKAQRRDESFVSHHGVQSCSVLVPGDERELGFSEQGFYTTWMRVGKVKTPAAVVEAAKAYGEEKQRQYRRANKVKQGQATLVKVCIPEVGQQI